MSNVPQGILTDQELGLYDHFIQRGDEARWGLGRLLVLHRPRFEHAADLFRYVANQKGENPRTLRGCHWLAYHVPVALQDRYPVLTRSQWRACLAWGVMVEEYEERVERTAEMAEWAVSVHADKYGGQIAPVTAIEAEIKRRKLTAKMGLLATHPDAKNPRSALSACLKACEVLLNGGGEDTGLVSLARVIGLHRG